MDSVIIENTFSAHTFFFSPQVMVDVAEVLTPLAQATEMLTTETLPAAGMVYPLLHELSEDMTVIERPHSQGQVEADAGDDSGDDEAESEYDSQMTAKLKTCIWERLKKRFDLTDDGQPHMDLILCCPLLIAAFCNPR